MGTTPTYSWPYPEPTDPVADGAQNIEDLALGVESTVADLGNYTDYSSSVTFAGFTLGNGTASAYYTEINDMIHFVGSAVLGSTSSVTGTIDVILPVNSRLSYPHPGGWGVCENAGVSIDTAVLTLGTTSVAFRALNNVSNWIRGTSTSPTVPFTWGTGDGFFWNVLYEKA